MLVPTIEEDHTIGEIALHKGIDHLDSYFQRHRLSEIDERAETLQVHADLYVLQKFGFRISKGREALVAVYVHEGAFREVVKEARVLAIENFVMRNAAWFFTYGVRTE